MKIIKAALLTILYCTIYYFFQFITGIVIYKTTDFHINGIGTVLCITVILSAILSFIAYQGIFLLRKMKIMKICNFKKLKFSYIPTAFILGISICLLNSSLTAVLAKIDFFEYHILKYQSLNFWIGETNTVFLVLALAITAPLIEEIMFRGMIFHELKQIMPVIPAVIIQGLLFGIYHFNIVQFIYASFLGIMFGLVYSWTQNLWIPVILHFSNNIMAVTAAKQPGTESIEGPDIRVFLISLVITVLLCLFFYKRRVTDYHE